MKQKQNNKNKNRNRSKRDIIQNVVLVILAVVVLCLCIAITIQSNNKSCYTAFNDSMIQIDKANDLKVTANIFEEQQLVILLESTSQDDIETEVQVEFKDADEKTISIDSTQTTILKDGKNMMFFDIPDLDEKYAGEIDINVKTYDAQGVVNVDLSKVIYQEIHEANDAGDTVFHVTGQNQNDAPILGLVGYIVALKDNKIVAYNSFTQERIEANQTFSFDTDFHGVLGQNNEVVPVDYDKLMIFSSFAMDDYENE